MLAGVPPLGWSGLKLFVVPITANTNEYNLHNVLTASPYNWDGVSQCQVIVNISAGVVIGGTDRSSISASASIGAFNIGAAFPAGSEIDLNIGSGAKIEGYGGDGAPTGGGGPGCYGGHAIVLPASMNALLKINNQGSIQGGGGGGASNSGSDGGAGAGGGAGTPGGAGGPCQSSLVPYGATNGSGGTATAGGGAGASAPVNGSIGVTTAGFAGAGGNPGQQGGYNNRGVSGAAPGPAGFAISLNGNASPTFTASGTIAGSIA